MIFISSRNTCEDDNTSVLVANHSAHLIFDNSQPFKCPVVHTVLQEHDYHAYNVSILGCISPQSWNS